MTTLQTMRQLAVGNRSVKLTAPYVPGVSATISVDSIDAAIILAAPNTVTLVDNSDTSMQYLVTVKYTAVTGNMLSGLTVETCDPALALTHTFAVDSKVYNTFNKSDVEIILSNTTALNEGKVEIHQGAANKNRSIVTNDAGDVVVGSSMQLPHMEGETAVFPGSSAYVDGTTVVF